MSIQMKYIDDDKKITPISPNVVYSLEKSIWYRQPTECVKSIVICFCVFIDKYKTIINDTKEIHLEKTTVNDKCFS